MTGESGFNRFNRFYIAGGTLPHDAPSYVVREADHQLTEGLRAGEFCYVLNTRQMGKSSLMVRTATRLAAEGITALALDLTALGQNVTVEQWYDGLLNQMGRELDIEDDLDDYWRSHRSLGPMARWMGALKDVALTRCTGSLVVFVDEIDVVKSLPFSTDEFFAGIRECYNQRTLHPDLNRLTFCLLGVATPASLVRDVRITPFNIGRRIDLRDFTEAEAAPLAAGLGTHALLSRVLYWTGGHPYLTQRLCQAVMDATDHKGAQRPAEVVDGICETVFLARRAQERDDNLLFVRDRILAEQTELTAILDLYTRILSGAAAPANDLGVAAGVLNLAGLVRSEKDRLRVRNRIYARVFNRSWVRDRMPDAELRRQRMAYRRGLARASGIAALIVGVLAWLSIIAVTNAQQSRTMAGTLKEALAVKAAAVSNRDTAIRNLKAALDTANSEHRRADHATKLERLREGQARSAAQTAQQKRQEADAQRGVALTRTRESQERAERLMVTAGTRAADEGDPNAALLWYDRAADLDLPSHSRHSANQLRIATTLRHLPRLVGMWFDARSACFLPGGRQILVAHSDGSARVYNTGSGALLSPAMRHGEGLASARFSLDGRRVLTYGGRTVRVWDAVTGTPVTPPLRSLSLVQDACFSPDGSLVAAGTLSGEAHVWSAATGHELHGANNNGANDYRDINHIEFSPDGRTIALSALYCGAIWRLAADAREHDTLVPVVGGSGPDRLAFSVDGTRLVSAGGDGVVRVWDAASGKPLTPPMRHGNHVFRAHFSPDGTRIVSASADHTAGVWDAATGSAVTPPLQHTGEVNDAVFSPDGSKVVTVGSDSNARIWDSTTGQSLSPPLWHSGIVLTGEFDPEGRRLLTVDRSGLARLWDLAGAGLPDGFAGEYANTACAAFSPDGKLLATGDFDWCARLRNAATGQAVGPVLAHNMPVRDSAFSPDGRILATGSDDHYTRLWDVHSGHLRAALRHEDGVDQLVFDAAGRRLATATNNVATIWEVSTGRKVCMLRVRTGRITTVALSPNGSQVLVGAQDGIARLLDATTGKLLRELPHAGPITAVAFSPDGRRLLTTSQDGTARVWDAGTGKPIMRPIWHQMAVYAGAFRPDGLRIVTADGYGDAHLWNAATGASLGPPLRHRDQVRYAAFSHDGRSVITCSADHTARIWDADTGAPLTPPLSHTNIVRRATFSPDDSQVVTICDDGIARLWKLTESWNRGYALRVRLELLAARHVDVKGGLLTLDPAAMRARWQALCPHRGADAPAPEVLHAWYLAQAYALIGTERESLALPQLDRLLELFPADRQACALRASTYARLGRWPDVVADLARLNHARPCLIVLSAHRPVQKTTPGHSGLKIGGVVHSQALSCWADSSVLVLLPAPARVFSAIAGAAQKPSPNISGTIRFSVSVAQREVAVVPERHEGQLGVSLSVPLGGATAFLLETRHQGEDPYAAWADPQVELMDGRMLRLSELPVWPVGGL